MSAAAPVIPWYAYPVTQGHKSSFPGQGETGIDLGVPFHTPITALFGGVVQDIKRGPWGLYVDLKSFVPQLGKTVTTNYTHLDTTAVSVGQSVPAGGLLGLSGGQLSGGSNPARPPFSTGPHVEFGIYQGGSFTSQAFDPTGIIQQAASGSLGTGTGSSGGGGGGASSGTPSWVQYIDLPGGIHIPIFDPFAAVGSLGSSIGGTIQHDLIAGAQRVAIFVLAIVLIVVGAILLFRPQLEKVGEAAMSVPEKVAGAAAVAE